MASQIVAYGLMLGCFLCVLFAALSMTALLLALQLPAGSLWEGIPWMR